MLSLLTAGLHCLFLLGTAWCQASQDSNFEPFIQYVIDSALGEESFHSEMQRQKRNMLIFDLPPVEYTVDIEVSLMDSSFLEQVKEYLKKLHLLVPTNISNVEMTVSNINVTTVCLPSGENSSCCSCENGYAWPSGVCSDLITCPPVSPAPDLLCGYMKEMPFYGPYCEPEVEGSCGMGEPIIMNMSVRLDRDFCDDLRDSSSVLYKNYKADLEKAFNASYRCLPGFVSATVTGFRPGSILVNYEVKAGAASFEQIANSNKIVPQFLDTRYHLDEATFTTEIINQTIFTVTPADFFEGDTVRLICEANSASENVTWYHFDQIISTSSRYSTERKVSRNSKSILKISNITRKDSGSYRCTFRNSDPFYTLIYKATKTIAVSPLNVTSNFNDITVICNSPEMQTNSPLLSCCIDRHLPSLTGDWKVNGAINITGVSSFSGNCTEYKLIINESLCPPEQSGTVMTYTCELHTGHGAWHSQNIRVTYLRAAHVTISSSISSVSEGYKFNLTCESDVTNYESISWKIWSGSKMKTVDCDTCIKNTKFPATSVLEVKNATQDWSGTYICTFSQKYLESSANVTIKVIPLPLKQNILIDPIEASIQCKVQQDLQCCISANTMEDYYTVTFVVQQKEFQVGKKRKGNLLCYMYSYTETECNKEKELTVYCKFTNSIKQTVNSENIRLQLIPDKEVSCSNSLGIGKEGATLKKPCCDVDNPDIFTRGNQVYKCINKVWKFERNNCLSEAINNLLTSAEALINSPEAKANLPNYLAELNKKTREQQNKTKSSPADLGAIITILDIVSSIPADAKMLTILNFLSTVDFVVADSATEAWEDLNKDSVLNSSLLLQSVENFSLRLQPVNNTIPSVSANTLQLQGIVVTENTNTDYNKNFSSTENLTVNVLISETEIRALTHNSTVVSVVYSKLGHILPQNGSEYVNGLLITTIMSSNGSQKFDINMTFAKKNTSLKMPQCVFWNFTLNERKGGWDTRGCTTTERGDYVICSCNHLTSFSILMSPDKYSQAIFEDYITYVGLAISILSLVACIIIESLVWKYVTNNTTSYMRHVCILNIATSLLIADIWFVVTASINDQNQRMSGGICFVATFFIHLFYLCVFFWMLSLGLILFYRLVFILHNTSKTAQKAVAFCLGYGCPFLIAVITLVVTLPRNNYIRKGVCWLNWKESKALLAFVIPALIIVATNLFITAVVIIKILRPTIGDRSNRQERNSLFQIGKSVAILTPLLGLTWGFGLATVIKNSHQAFHILFALLNALQGLFILVFGTLWDKKIQEALLKRNSMSKWSSQQTKSSSLILVTPMLAMSYPLSRTFNNLCGKTGKYRVSSSEPSTSSSENTSKAYSLLN
ncbi:adhesion G protein-coupled receptor F5 isoform X1 [Falco peregrinus]|uniref:adhesion G protein-coupled receptor F5 isoform X1 n=1 Tax=Falco peregrinus TaxID=8954 RepID=UPI002479949C|nr:adhesion G protein-coupled receptor F5 isoform X1 [Falco peregrinus]XP_055666806.1 adhesion G protein-coupled receptor F5 isoform X1 [Falco peregrinus]